MRWSGRLVRLLVVVAVALLACTPHRQHASSEGQFALAEVPDHIAGVALSAVGLDPVILKRYAAAQVTVADTGRRLLPGPGLLLLAALASVVATTRRWATTVVAWVQRAITRPRSTYCLRAPPRPA